MDLNTSFPFFFFLIADYPFLFNIYHLFLCYSPCQDLFSVGIDTTSSIVEWAMAELLSNPKAMAKARCELDEVLGKNTIV